MIWIILSALSYIGIFLVFKIIDIKNVPLLNSIVVNYLTATILGFVIYGSIPMSQIVSASWLWMGIFLGVLFILNFFLIGICSHKAGMCITTVASKMSLVIPMTFSILMFSEPVSALKVISILLAVVSVFLCTYRPDNFGTKFKFAQIILPVSLFLGMGIVDSLVIFSKEKYVADAEASLFSASLFAISFICGLAYSVTKVATIKSFAKINVWLCGIMLGALNFGSIYFVIRAMNSEVLSNSIIYGICNTTAVLLSIILGMLIFKEKMSHLNLFGGFMAIVTIILMTLSNG